MTEPQQRDEYLRNIPLREYMAAHSGGGNGWRGFFKSNLFSALVIFILTQSVFVGGLFITIFMKVNTFGEWKGNVDKTLEVFNKQGSPILRSEVQNHMTSSAEKFGDLDARMKTVEEATKHLDVMEWEHRRITEDLEKLKNAKK